MSVTRVVLLGLAQVAVISWSVHAATGHHASGNGSDRPIGHGGHVEQIDPLLHYLRDTALAAPFVIGVLIVATALARRVTGAAPAEGVRAKLVFATVAAVVVALATVPGAAAHAWLFGAELGETPWIAHTGGLALVALRYTFAISLGAALAFGVPWAGNPPTDRFPDRNARTEVVPC